LGQFGLYVGGLGITPNDPSSVYARLRCAVERDPECNIDPVLYENDIDGDKVRDVDELGDGIDPAKPGNPSVCGATYGCGARVEPRGKVDAGALAAVALALAAFCAARRTRSED
jgi:hypothetical protein